MSLKTIVVDDDLMARESLKRLCEKTEALTFVKALEDGQSALEFLSNEKIDLILLDVEMPGISGLELIDQLPYLPQIVITTSNTDYAFDALEYEVTDFLKKPINQPRFLKAVEKIVARQDQLGKMLSLSAQKELYVKTDGRLIRLDYDDIFYFENVGDYIKVISTKGVHIIYGALKTINEKLDNPRFLKVHRSYIINLDKVVDIEDNSIVIKDKVIPISRAHKPILLSSLNIL